MILNINSKDMENIQIIISQNSINVDRKTDNRVLKPFTQKELVERAKLANLDYKAGNIISQELLEIESESW